MLATSPPLATAELDGSSLRGRITTAYRLAEPAAVAARLAEARMDPDTTRCVRGLAMRLATHLREREGAGGREGLVQGLMQEYALSSQEGVALMCLAEALLRIPDVATRDALIRDKIARGNWRGNAGRTSPSLFVNAASWGLLLTGKLVATHSENTLSGQLTRLIARGGEPLIRKGVDVAMRMMGEQFVMGETIAEALARADRLEARGFRYSYDMLGEAAMTGADAERYRQSYEAAIHAIGKASGARGVYQGPGISIKLSALHPRYSRAQRERVMSELYPVLRGLVLLAHEHDVGINIDAEEADRLELSLDLLERLCLEPGLRGWHGIGFVVQAYQKRCPYVIDYLIDLARRSGHRMMVRLVKGAYWDTEIKRAQVEGQSGFPVYTRKVYTDVSYIACARKLLAAPEQIYPQFATHNAYTLAAVYTLADPTRYRPGQYEFQCLHGMGEPLYEHIVNSADDGGLGRPCRIYAPAGTHDTLLAYLVRRLLENGANTSFVNRIADPSVALEDLVEDPVAVVDRLGLEEGEVGRPHPRIAAPHSLFGRWRANSEGMDLTNELTLQELQGELDRSREIAWRAEPVLATAGAGSDTALQPVLNPADHRDVVGQVRDATPVEVEAAVGAAGVFAPQWARTPVAERVAALERAADALQQRLPVLLGLLAREAGKTWADGIAEVREAVDFLRFYASHARADLGGADCQPLGPVVCISPWNFPLSIFTGQIAAALAAGNPVLAKPAEQTPLVAAEAVRILLGAGIPRAALQLLPGDGPGVGTPLVADARVQGVMFTGSTEVARLLQQALAGRTGITGAPVPLIAETGGQNAMIVDSSALPEQVVADVVNSAFGSAGQRCSALRVLCVQDDAADRLITMLRGAVAEETVANPDALHTDVGPVIDDEARAGIERHVRSMQDAGHRVERLGRLDSDALAQGTYVTPALVEIDRLSELRREVFGPVLHVLRYRRDELPQLVAQVNATGYGLTLGIHTRIDETIRDISTRARVGNVYVNRNIVGAVVGVQPFGGEGLSGTGPKAGGPLYLYRLLARKPDDVLVRAPRAALPDARPEEAGHDATGAAAALHDWIRGRRDGALTASCNRLAECAAADRRWVLAGPTGEKNVYLLRPREAALCLAGREDALLFQTLGALLMGCGAAWPLDSESRSLYASLPPTAQDQIALVDDWTAAAVRFDVALFQGDHTHLADAALRLARRPGPIVSLWRFDPELGEAPLEALVIEQSVSTNTAAAGGNASLMMIG